MCWMNWIYMYDNWENGELAAGPEITRHFITATFMWPREEMPIPWVVKDLQIMAVKYFLKRMFISIPRKVLNKMILDLWH